MATSWTDRWNDRYSKEEYAYGEQPNDYLRIQLEKLSKGSILFPAEGEGRNAVYAARLGWTVAAFDISSEGKSKALRLAAAKHVHIDYQVGEIETLDYRIGEFDAIALIYAHFPADVKSRYHKALNKYLRTGGTIIFEAFSKKHLEYIARDSNMGGPRDIGSLFSIEEIRSDFADYDILELTEMEVGLNEGPFHRGLGSVIRFVGMKK